MELVREKTFTNVDVNTEAQQHNAMIKERYRRLQNAIADQLAEDTHTNDERVSEAYTEVAAEQSLYISPSEARPGALEQAPQVTEYVAPTTATAVFTTEKFNAMPTPTASVKPAQVTAVATEAHYSLTPFAKVAMAVFTFVIVAMLTMICVNTNLIRQKNIKNKNLEQKKEQLMEQNEEIQRRIEDMTTEEAIRSYAESQGMIWMGK